MKKSNTGGNDGSPRRVRSRRPILSVIGAASVLLAALPATGDVPVDSRERASQPSSRESLQFGGDYSDQGITVEDTTARVTKAKVSFRFPTVYLRANLITCFAPTDSSTYFGNETGVKICQQLGHLPIPSQYWDSTGNAGFVGGSADAYIADARPGKTLSYGSFPPVTVKALAFGSVPVSAVVHLRQATNNGYVEPIRARYNNLANLALPGAQAYPGFGRVPPLKDNQPWDLVIRNTITATLTAEISDVTIDGRAVEVGKRCSTVAPVKLHAEEPLGYSPEAGPNVRGLPGGFRPAAASFGDLIDHPGYFDGSASIPAFSNCGSTSEDLDSLLTSLISSRNNSVSGYLPRGVADQFWCSLPVANCSDSTIASQKRMQSLARAIANHETRASIEKIQSQLSPSDYVLPRVKASRHG